MSVPGFEIHPVTADRWHDLERLFGPSGAYSGCWCMWWRVTSAEFAAQAGEGLRARLAALIDEGRVPGLLAYRSGDPVGWVSLGDRSEFGRLNRSPKLKPIDDQTVCSVVCFFIERGARRAGMAAALLEAAEDQARGQAVAVMEAYPIDTSHRDRPAADLFTGSVDLFSRAGYTEVERRGGRPIMRKKLR